MWSNTSFILIFSGHNIYQDSLRKIHSRFLENLRYQKRSSTMVTQVHIVRSVVGCLPTDCTLSIIRLLFQEGSPKGPAGDLVIKPTQSVCLRPFSSVSLRGGPVFSQCSSHSGLHTVFTLFVFFLWRPPWHCAVSRTLCGTFGGSYCCNLLGFLIIDLQIPQSFRACYL